MCFTYHLLIRIVSECLSNIAVSSNIQLVNPVKSREKRTATLIQNNAIQMDGFFLF